MRVYNNTYDNYNLIDIEQPINRKPPDNKLIKEFVESQKQVREMFRQAQMGRQYRQQKIVEDLKPLIDPLEEIKQEIKRPKPLAIDLPKPKPLTIDLPEPKPEPKPLAIDLPEPKPLAINAGDLATKYLGYNFDSSKIGDNTFGIRSEQGNELWIGNKSVSIDNNAVIINSQKYDGTDGLWQLLTLKEPKNFTETDLRNYYDIIITTSAYRKNNDPFSNGIKSSNGYKYMHIIRPFLLSKNLIKSPKHEGSGFSKKLLNPGKYKMFTKTPKEYVYYDDEDELIERLKFLCDERDAGNNSPEIYNEITNIIEELIERGWIFK